MPGTSSGGKKAAATRGRDSLSEAGKKGAQARSHQSRVLGGQKAAQTRGKDSLSEAGKKGAMARTHESRVEGGKKAAQKRADKRKEVS